MEEWSATGGKYKDGEVFRKWKSYRPDPAGRVPVTVRSVFKLATDAGWVHTKLAAKVKIAVTDWIRDCDDADVLLSEGAKRIAENPLSNDMIEASLHATLQKKIKELGGGSIGLGTIKGQVAKCRHEQHAAEKDLGLERKRGS